MKEKFDIEQPHLKENPYTVPEGYFSSFQSNISEIISHKDSKVGAWTFIKPQLALVLSFAAIFLMGYVAIRIFTPEKATLDNPDSILANSTLLEQHHLEPSFIDFFDEETDSLPQKSEINPEEIVEYLNTDTGLMYLASLE